MTRSKVSGNDEQTDSIPNPFEKSSELPPKISAVPSSLSTNLPLVSSSKSPHLDLIKVLPAKKRENKFFKYYIALSGLVLVGICAIWGLNSEVNRENLFFNLLLMTGSITILLGASNIVLDNSVHLAEIFHVPEIVIGLTLVSIGTSIPEIFTSIISSYQGEGSLTVGDIYGSWITQLTIFLGIVILIRPNTVGKSFIPFVKRDAGIMILSLVFLSIHILNGSIKRWEAIVSICLFLTYDIYLYIDARRNPVSRVEILYDKTQLAQEMGIQSLQKTAKVLDSALINEGIAVQSSQEVKVNGFSKWRSVLKSLGYLLLLILGVLLCYIGARFVVQSGADTARIFDVSEFVIGVIIVGFGTGLPELIVSFAAMAKNKPDIAYGNILGSNIVDPLFSISLGVLVRPIDLTQNEVWNILGISLPVAVIVGLSIIFFFTRKKVTKGIGMIMGLILMSYYFIYIVLTIVLARFI